MKAIKYLTYNLQRTFEEDPSVHSKIEILLLHPHIKALFFYRIAHVFYKLHLYFLAHFISNIGKFFTMIEIHPGATIGKGLVIDHGVGVVIGETAIIGDNVTIFHGVTLGGTGKDRGNKRHPTVGDNVVIGAGAKCLGNIKLADGAKVGANAVVLTDVTAFGTIVGTKAKEVYKAKDYEI